MDRSKQVEQTRDFFDTAASGWTSRYALDASFANRQIRFLNAVQAKLPRSAEILDFGCGSGDIALYLSERGYQVTGCDLSVAMLTQARLADRNNRVNWHALQSAKSLPFGDATFDAVVASSVFEYLPDIGMTLTQLTHALRSGGWLFATVPDTRNPLRRRERWLRWAATAPVIATLLDYSRWREGAAYMRISTNRLSCAAWLQHIRAAGFATEDLPESTSPLLLLAARKI